MILGVILSAIRIKFKLAEIRIKVNTQHKIIIEVGKNPDTADYLGNIN